MRRREFITGLGVAAATPLGARAQQSSQPQRIARVGLLNYATAQYARVDDFRRELGELGYVEGKT